MDNSADPTITFDENGYCNYCIDTLKQIGKTYMPDKNGEKILNQLISDVKNEGKGKKYDCIMGLSGGLDSSYLAYLGHKWGLRVLALHVDDGYDTDISKSNLCKLVDRTGFDYEIITPDAEQFNALTLAYMKAGVPNIAVPQDNILTAFLYKKIKEYKIKYFFSGDNFALECIMQKGNTYKVADKENIFDIHKRFGDKSIDKLIFISTIQKELDKKIAAVKTVTPLNYVDYNRERAFKELKDFCGFEYYGGKHLENILTAFIQLYWFPNKFGVDKRKSHLSSMIVSGQLTRDDALKQLEKPLYSYEEMRIYLEVVAEKLGISINDIELMAKIPGHQHTEYKTEDETLIYRLLRFIHKIID